MKIVEKAGGIVLNPHGDILIVTNAGTNLISIPKGSLEPGETHEQAAKREILEEGGIKRVVIVQELGTIVRPGYTADNHDIPSVTKRIRVYLCTTDEIELQPEDKGVIKAEWVRKDKVPEILSWPEEREFFLQHQDVFNR